MKKMEYKKAICYSGYRKDHSPLKKIYPSYEEIKEDLIIISKDFDYIRMYDPSQHAKTTLEVIKKENLELEVMLGIDLLGEVDNPDCAWGGDYTDEEIKQNIAYNEQQLKNLINLANEYEDIIIAVSAGNEAVPEWNENLVLPERVLYYVNELKKNTDQIVTYCDNYVYWEEKLKDVAEAVDVISIHTYPAWLSIPVEESAKVSIKDYKKVKDLYPDKQVIITEAGWTTNSSGREIKPKDANEDNQTQYITEFDKWAEENEVIVFFFEAFDEPWKGSDNNPMEPEKHWGLYTVDRQPKKVMTELKK